MDDVKETVEEKKRTIQQNKAIHVLFEMLATKLNDAGMDMRKVLKPEVDIPWTKHSVKEYMWRPVQEAMLGKVSTTDLNTKDIDKVFETINRHIAKFGVSVEFPSIEEVMEVQEDLRDK